MALVLPSTSRVNADDATGAPTIATVSWVDTNSGAVTPAAGAQSGSSTVPAAALQISAEPGSEVVPTEPPAACSRCEHSWFGCEPGFLENLSLFFGIDGSKGPEDLGINANFGYRGAVNWAVPVWEEYGLGFQVGTAINFGNTAVRVLPLITGTDHRVQSFTTVGLFQRTPFGFSWGVVYDFLAEDYYQNIVLGQFRGQIGHTLGSNDEVGVWAAIRNFGDRASVAGETFSLKPITQGNLYWRHIWPNDTVTRIWAGIAEDHGRFLLVAPGEGPVRHPFVFGADLFVPLTDSLSIFGEANFVTPNDTGTVTATLGIAFYPGGRTRSAVRGRFAPLLPVANNATFGVDLQQ